MSWKRILSVIIVIVLMTSLICFDVYAVDLYEVENNNTVGNATTTYDDYNNYGAISSSTDVDWWKVTFNQTGYANFWLGNVPQNCVYFMYLYESDGSYRLAESTNTAAGGQQLIKAKVYAGVTYTIQITEWNGYSSSSYLFRVKNYTETQQARIYTVYDYQGSGSINFRENASVILPYTSSMGFSDTERYNYTSTQLYNELDDINLAVITTHGEPGRIVLGEESCLVANNITYSYPDYKGLGQYPAQALSNVKLLCFENCKSGKTGETHGNFVDSARNLGVTCCIGWKESFYHDDIIAWNDVFFGDLSYGYNIGEAMEDANLMIYDQALEYYSISSQYYGSSSMHSLVLA